MAVMKLKTVALVGAMTIAAGAAAGTNVRLVRAGEGFSTNFATLFPSVKQAKQKIKLPNDSWQYLVWKPVGGMALIFK